MDLQDRIRIGISGWNYPPWRGKFYPAKLPHNRELAFAAHIFRTIEVNGTFYCLQRPDDFARWADSVPEDFVFSIKGSRFITHMLRLKETRVALANFLASGLLRLGPKLGPILWQLPPNFRFDVKRVQAFLKLLPRDTEAAAALARRHDERVSRRSWMRTDTVRPLRHCMEIRHVSFQTPAFLELLRQYGVGLVCADAVEWPRLMDVTTDFVYCRLHGSKELYVSGYGPRALDVWAKRVVAWARGREPGDAEHVAAAATRQARRDVFVYFDNDAKVRAPFDAQELVKRVREAAQEAGSASAGLLTAVPPAGIRASEG